MILLFNRFRVIRELSNTLQELAEKLSKYLSPQIYQSIFSGETDVTVSTNRKKLTVFFSDIKDFTATTEDLQPEDLTFILNDYFTAMSAIVREHGGTLDKFIGDAIVVFFGDPFTKGVKEDAAACVKMAIAMQRKMVDLRSKWEDLGYEKPLHMRIGVNTGYCNVGNFGSDDRIDYTIIGGEVNLAARLESITEPDGVTMSYETYVNVKDFVHAEEQEAIKVKGIRRDVRPFKVVGLLDELAEDGEYVHRSRPGVTISIDLKKASPEEARKELTEAMQALDGGGVKK
jgi:class 3 adenylate cyclase